AASFASSLFSSLFPAIVFTPFSYMCGFYSATKTQSHQDDIIIFNTGFDNRHIAIAFSLADKKITHIPSLCLGG
ncbi:MAG: hypothetical protein JW976_01800, partial [Syntrophaceae bacterium]|nr:hypothetical protein [Syntrophaceae bacterium]